MLHELRYGRFTSSKIGCLMSLSKDKKDFGATAKKYIKQKKYERKLGRRIDTENTARPLQYGKCVEGIAFQKLGTAYRICSDETIPHPLYDFWSGSPDLIKYVGDEKVICDIKCPMTLESFCDFVEYFSANGIQGIRDNHPDGETYYWQIVSNCILCGSTKGELIIYAPYQEELQSIKDEASAWGYAWLTFASDLELPYLTKDGSYKDINVMAFDIPQSDIDALTANVIKANELCGYTDFLNTKS